MTGLAPEPDGTLPYRDAGRIGYRGMAAPPRPAFAFGTGLGYDDLTCDDLEVERDGDGLVATVAVRNLAARAASATVRIYLTAGMPGRGGGARALHEWPTSHHRRRLASDRGGAGHDEDADRGTGIDLGKNGCGLAEPDASGAVATRRGMTREGVIAFVADLPACVAAMETCRGAHSSGGRSWGPVTRCG